MTFRARLTGTAAIVLSAVAAATPSHALLIDLIPDASVSAAPAGFTTDLRAAANLLQAAYTDPITINVAVGWGEIDGVGLNPGNLGQSLTNQVNSLTYAQVRTALINDQTTPTDTQAVGTLGAADPTGGRQFRMSRAEGKALGFVPGNAGGTDGWIGFDSAAAYTFDPDNRAIAGEFDFFGLALHELTEVMGRYGMTQNGCNAPLCDSPLDLFRYAAANSLALNPRNGSYFSIDGGGTILNTYNGTGGGDLSDWRGDTPDAFNESLTPGTLEAFSEADMELMDAIGFDRDIPEPATIGLFTLSLLGFSVLRRRR